MARQSRQHVPAILLTRPAEQSARFAKALQHAFGPGLTILVSPLMEPEYLSPAIDFTRVKGVVLTSETGAKALGRLGPPAGLPAWCVGDRTASAARSVGLAARSAGGDAAALRALVVAEGVAGPLLFARGSEVAADLAQELTSAGIETFSGIFYAQKPVPLTSDAAQLLARNHPVILPIFSARSALRLIEDSRAGHFIAPLWIAAISRAVCDAARPLLPARVAVAAQPDGPGMVAAVQALLAAGEMP
jgi:uroporphyrinogen-III synthase